MKSTVRLRDRVSASLSGPGSACLREKDGGGGIRAWSSNTERELTCVRCTGAEFLPLAFSLFFFFFSFSPCNSLSCAGCFILTMHLLMAYVLPSLS